MKYADEAFHPLIIVRQKYPSGEILESDFLFEQQYEKFRRVWINFIQFCDETIRELELVPISREEDIKEKSYLLSKIRRKSRSIKLRPSQSNIPLFGRIRQEYELVQTEYIRAWDDLELQWISKKRSETSELREFFGNHKDLLNMTFLTDSMIYDNAQKFIREEKIPAKSQRKVEKQLTRHLTKCAAKASPLWKSNAVSFASNRIDSFQYSVDTPLITPNIVFSQAF